jgi:iron complex outermembrane receptor protein
MLVAGAIAFGPTARAQPAAPVLVDVRVPAGPVADALSRFAQQAGVAIVVDADRLAGRTTRGLTGRIGIDEGFRTLLDGTGYRVERVGAGYAVVAGPAGVATPVAAPAPARGAAAASPAAPRDATPTATDAAPSAPTLPESVGAPVMVVARRLTDVGIGDSSDFGILGQRPIVDTPFSVSAYTAELVRNTTSTTLRELLRQDASVTFAAPDDAFTIRGFPVSRKAFLYDGQIGLAGLLTQPAYLERIEVLRGANALVSGLNVFGGIGGSVNLVPKKPTDDLRSVSVGFAGQSAINAAVDLSTRFGADRQFGTRLNVAALNGNSTRFANVDERRESYSLYSDWKPTQSLYLALDLAHQSEHTTGIPMSPFFALLDGNGDVVPVPSRPPGRLTNAQPWNSANYAQSRAVLKGLWRFADDWSIEVGYGRVMPDKNRPAFLGGPFVIDAQGNALLDTRKETFWTETESLQATLRGRYTLASVDNKVSLGLARFKEREQNDSAFFATLPQNIYRPVTYPQPDGTQVRLGQGQQIGRTAVLVNDASFAQDRWRVLAGARMVDIESRQDYPFFGFFQDLNQSRTSPFASLSYKPSASTLAYLSYSEALEPGPSAPLIAVNFPRFLPPGVTRQQEVGVKVQRGDWLATAALFRMSRPLAYLAPSGVFDYNGRQVHEGLELQLQGQVARGVRLISGVTLLDPSIDDNGDPTVRGNTAPGVARRVATVYGEYDLPALPGLTATGGLRHQGAVFLDVANAPQRRLDGFTTVDLGVRYRTTVRSQLTTLALNVFNVTDSLHWLTDSFSQLYVAAPRTVRVQATVEF